MNKITIGKMLSIILMLLVMSTGVLAQPPHMMGGPMDEEMRERMQEQGYGSGPGYGGGPGYGWGAGYGRGYDYGRGYGYGPMGPMMGGPMMGGPMMGGHMMGSGPMAYLYQLDLSKDQRTKVRALHRDVRKAHLALMEEMMDKSDKLLDLYAEDTPDVEKIGKVYDEIFVIRRKMIQQHIQLRNDTYKLLTKEQREKAREFEPMRGRFGMME